MIKLYIIGCDSKKKNYNIFNWLKSSLIGFYVEGAQYFFGSLKRLAPIN